MKLWKTEGVIYTIFNSVLHPDTILGELFQMGICSPFVNTSKVLLISTMLHTFNHCLFSCLRCSFEQNTRELIAYLRNLSENNNFLFLFFIFGAFSWVAVMLERFQSGCDLATISLSGHQNLDKFANEYIASNASLKAVNSQSRSTICSLKMNQLTSLIAQGVRGQRPFHPPM